MSGEPFAFFFWQVVREYHSDGEERHEAFFQTSDEASKWIATETVDDVQHSIVDFLVYRCGFAIEPRLEVARIKGRG